MDAKRRASEIRFRNFDELMRRYGGSPTTFCEKTGYANKVVISQLKGRKRAFGDSLARQLEEAAGLPKFALENEHGLDAAPASRKPADKVAWPFSFPLEDFLALSGKSKRDIDDALTKMVIGAQAQEVLQRQRRSGS